MSGSDKWLVVGVGLLAGAAVLGGILFGLTALVSSPPEVDPVDRPEGTASDRDGDHGVDRIDVPDPPAPGQPRRPGGRSSPGTGDDAAAVSGVHGRVVDVNRRPVRGAEVRLYQTSVRRPTHERGEELQSTTTDLDGKYRFADVEPGTGYIVEATLQSFAPATLAGITVHAEEPTKIRDLRMVTGATIRGTVLDANGLPIAGARVLAVVQKVLGTNIFDTPGDHATTDGSGYYEIRHVPPGVRTVYAGARGYGTVAVPDVTLEDQVDVENVDFRLPEGGRITGYVYEVDTSVPIEGARINAVPVKRTDPTRASTRTDANGFFELVDLSDSAFRITVRKEGYVPPGFRSARHGAELEFFMERNGGVRGVVVDAASGAPIPSFRIRYGEDRGGKITGPGRHREFEDENGAFEVFDLNPNRWIFEAWADGYAFAKSEPIEIEKGQWREGVVLQLERGAEVRGRVVSALDGSPIGAATVSVRPDNNLPALILEQLNPAYLRQARTASDGGFVVTGVGSETMRVDVEHPRYLPSQREGVEVPRTGTVDVGAIRLAEGGIIEGTVRRSNGTPVRRATILLDQDDGDYRYRVRSKADGGYRFDKVPAGVYTLRIERVPPPDRFDDFPVRSTAVAEGETSTVDF